MKVVRTYMNFTKEVDPASIVTMADLEISFALASTLVAFNFERQVVSALAERWNIVSPNRIDFVLRKNLKWSNGSEITSNDFKISLERAKRDYPTDLKALFDVISEIKTEGSSTLVIITKEEISKTGILMKLCEPMFGLVYIKNGKPDLTISSGPFFLESKTEDSIVLKSNSNWFEYNKEMPPMVEIKRPPKDVDLIESFESDSWVNLISGTSLMNSSTKTKMDSLGYKTWQRSLDKVYSIYPSKNFVISGGAELINNLASKLNMKDLTKGFTGYTLADQFFPRGYELWSPQKAKVNLHTQYKGKNTIRVIIPNNPYAVAIKDNLTKALIAATGLKYEVILVPLPELKDYMKKGDYDLLVGGVAVADPNFEGAMSFFIERDPPFIPSGNAPFDFGKQTKEARGLLSSKDRAAKMRDIIIKAQEAGHVLPLFHFSSLAISKPGVDLSEIPNSDEAVLFSKVRMR